MPESTPLVPFPEKDGRSHFCGEWVERPKVIAKGLKGPQGMTIGNDGNLIVMLGLRGRRK